MKTNQLLMLALIGGSLVACTKNESQKPADNAQAFGSTQVTAATAESDPCEVCDWDNALNMELKVRQVFCAGPHAHCHLLVTDYNPKRTATVAEVAGGYSFNMLSLAATGPDSGSMSCPLLTVDPNNEDRIVGRCTIVEPDMQGGAEHNFSAVIERDPDEDSKFRLIISFNHAGIAGGTSNPVHNGEVHVNQ